MTKPADSLNVYGPGDDDYGRKKMTKPTDDPRELKIQMLKDLGFDDPDWGDRIHCPQFAYEIVETLVDAGWRKK